MQQFKYRAEVYDSNLTYVTNFVIGNNFNFIDDYLDMQINKLTVGSFVNIQKNYYLRILKNEKEYLNTICYDANFNGYETDIEFIDIKSIFDRNIKVNKIFNDAETLLNESIKNLYVTNIDTFEIFPIKTNILTETKYTNEIAVYNLLELIILLFKDYSIKLDIDIDYNNSIININIYQFIEDYKYIETKFNDVINVEINKAGKIGSYNKITFENLNNTDQVITYYLDYNNNIITENINRVLPVISDYRIIEAEEVDFLQTTYEEALNDMKNTAYNELIEIEIINDSKLFYNFKIGQKAYVDINGIIHDTIITGIEYDDTSFILYCGFVRIDLTAILKEGGF